MEAGAHSCFGRRREQMENVFEPQENSHWLHIVITAKSSFNKTTLEQLGNIPQITTNGASIFTIHETSGSSRHAHYVHWCPSWQRGRGCNCGYIRKARQLGFSTKCQYVGEMSQDHWINLLSYLQKKGKVTISAHQNYSNKLDKLRHAFGQVTASQWNSSRNNFRCSYDAIEGPSVPKPTNGTTGEVARTSRTQKFSDVATCIYHLYQTNMWLSTEHAFKDPIFINQFQDMYYTYTESLKRINSLVFDQLQDEWRSLSFEEIMLKRKNNTFNDCLYYSNEYSTWVLLRLLKCQLGTWDNIVTFLDHVLNILNKQYPKINTLNIKGAPGSGKTWFVECLGKLCWFTGRCDSSINKFTQFPFEHMLGKRLTIFNEFNLAPSFKDVVKEILEGANVSINVKYRPRCILERVPVIITTNNNWEHDHPMVDRQAFAQRMITYEWHPQPWLKNEEGYPHPPAIANLFYKTAEELMDIDRKVPPKEFINEYDLKPNFDKQLFLNELNKDFN